MDYITVLEYIGLVAFAASGALIAIREEYDLFGVFILAMVTAVGGGIIRDITTNEGVPVFFQHPDWVLYISVGIILAVIFRGRFKNHFLFIFTDALGLASFVTSSALVGINKEYDFLLYLYCAIMPGIGGGILRDVLARQKPMVLCKEIYSIAAMAGATFLWFVHPYLSVRVSTFLCLSVILMIRLFTYRKGINLPILQLHENGSASRLGMKKKGKNESELL